LSNRLQIAYEQAKQGQAINLKSFAALGAFHLIYCSEKRELKKKELLESIILKSANHLDDAKSHQDEIRQHLGRIYGNDNVLSLDCQLEYRGLFGAGSSFGQAAFEVGLAFDTVLNLPFLPGSSVKGAVRAAYREEHKGKEEETFGSPDRRSDVIFADAYPVELNAGWKHILYPDIINPHYANDGMDEKVEPIPIIHLTVAPGSTFRFLIAFRGRQHFREVLDGFAVACHKGLGARTAIGYGKFKLLKVE
jgi:CRISPR-associated protein Cmr6